MPTAESDSDNATSSDLSDVDESFLDESDDADTKIQDHRKVVGRPKTSKKKSGVDARDKTHGRTALHKAASRGNLAKMKDLIEIQGATIDITDNAGVTPLHDACTQGRVEAVKYLLTAGAAVSPKDCQGDYPLLDAAQTDNLQICQILLDAGANPTMQNSEGMSALSEAEEGPLKDLLRSFSSRFHSPGQNRMKITDVLSADDTTSAETTRKASPRLRQSRSGKVNTGAQGIRNVDIHGRDQLHRYVLEADDDLIEQFLEIQDADNQDNYGDTPLHAAARAGNAHICGILLQHGASVKIPNKQGNTALHEAAHTRKSREVIVALLDAGSSSLIENAQGQLPSDIATAKLGEDSSEARLLQKTLLKERQKKEDKERKRAARLERNGGSVSGSARSTPMHSPKVLRDADQGHVEASAANTSNGSNFKTSNIATMSNEDLLSRIKSPASIPAASRSPTKSTSTAQGADSPKPTEVAITIATTEPPEIVTSTKQVVSMGLPTTQFLTELKSNPLLSQIDSSVRGSPLPAPPAPKTTAPYPAASKTTKCTTHADSTTMPIVSPNISKKRQVNGGTDASNAQKKSRLDSEVHSQNETIHEDHGMIAAMRKMNTEILAAMERQNQLLQAMLRGINTLVQAQQE